jgi:hypothetical protein
MWHWLQAARPFVERQLASGALIYAFVSEAWIRQILDSFFSCRSDSSSQVWGLVVLERWLSTQARWGT